MQRWQYRVIDLGIFFTGERLVRVLGELGAEGWELVAIYDKNSNWIAGLEKGFALLRRDVPDGSEPDGPWGALLFASQESLRVDELVVCSGCGMEYRGSAGVVMCVECGNTL